MKLRRSLVTVQCVDVEPVLQRFHDRLHGARRVLERVAVARSEGGLLVPRRHVPQLDRRVTTPRGQQLTVGRECYRGDTVLVPLPGG